MVKTIQDYLHDPRLAGDPLLARELEPVREIYASRLKLQDETAAMTQAEKVAYINMRAQTSLARMGKTLYA
jgi:hypothetical protein